MLVALVMSLLLAIAVPNWVRSGQASRAKACSVNLQRMEDAKEMWATERGQSGAGRPVEAELYGPGAYLRRAPVCPDGGTYATGDLLTQATCSHGGTGVMAHALSDPSRVAAASAGGQPAGGSGVLFLTLASAGAVMCLFISASLRAGLGDLLLSLRSRYPGQ